MVQQTTCHLNLAGSIGRQMPRAAPLWSAGPHLSVTPCAQREHCVPWATEVASCAQTHHLSTSWGSETIVPYLSADGATWSWVWGSRGRVVKKKEVAFWCLQGFTGQDSPPRDLVALLARKGVCESSKGGVSVWFLRACEHVCVCASRYIWAGMDRGGLGGTGLHLKKTEGGEKKEKEDGNLSECWCGLKKKGGWGCLGFQPGEIRVAYALHVRLRLTVGHCGKVDSSARKK